MPQGNEAHMLQLPSLCPPEPKSHNERSLVCCNKDPVRLASAPPQKKERKEFLCVGVWETHQEKKELPSWLQGAFRMLRAPLGLEVEADASLLCSGNPSCISIFVTEMRNGLALWVAQSVV